MLAHIKHETYLEGEIINFTQIICRGCGIPFMVPSHWYYTKKENLASFHCPNGCHRKFAGKTEAQKLREQLDAEISKSIYEKKEMTEKYSSVLHEKNSLELKLKRVSKGVCPCCKRSFSNLQRHMEAKHGRKK